MGNRAVISFSERRAAPSIYLHWNGGRASVEGFLEGCRSGGYKATGDADKDTQFIARAIAPFFIQNGEVGRLTVYEQPVGRADCDNGNNGWYIIDQKTLEIVKRIHKRGAEEFDPNKTEAIAAEIHGILTRPACRYEHIWGCND